MDLDRLERLVMLFHTAKRKENFERVKRIAVEEEIAELVPTGDTSSKTVTLLSGRKVTVKRGLIYKADLGSMERTLIPYAQPAPIKSETTRKLDIEGYEWYRVNQPDIFRKIAEHVTITPRKVAVTLREPKGE